MKDSRSIHMPLSRRLEGFRKRQAPIIIWIGAIVAIVLLFENRVAQTEYVGWVLPQQHEVSSTVTGRLDTLMVSLYGHVEAGDIVARLDDRPILAQIDTAKAAIERLRAQLEATRQQLSLDRETRTVDTQADLRRFQNEQERYRLDAMSLAVEIEADGVKEQRLELDLERSEKLAKESVISQQDYDNIRLELGEVQRRIEENKKLRAQTLEAYEQAKQRTASFAKTQTSLLETEDLLLPFRKSVEEEEYQLQELNLERRMLVLVAPVSGQATLIPCSEGQAVVPGEPIIVLTQTRSTQIVAYDRSEGTRQIKQAAAVELRSMSRPERVVRSEVASIGPTVEQLPQRFWADQRTPEYGRPFLIDNPPEASFAPGEILQIHILSGE